MITYTALRVRVGMMVALSILVTNATNHGDKIMKTTTNRHSEILSALSQHDHGDGCLGIIIDYALQDNPDVTVEEVAEIVVQAEEDAAAERADQIAYAHACGYTD